MRRVVLATVVAGLAAGCISVPERDFPAFAGPPDARTDLGDAPGAVSDRGPAFDAPAERPPFDGPPPLVDRASPTDLAADRVSPADAAPLPDRLSWPDRADRPDATDLSGAPDRGPLPGDTHPIADATRHPPDISCAMTPEVCNGLDDDCDGFVDDNLSEVACYSGPPETVGRGVCRAGVQTCTEGVLDACAGEYLPGREVCNGLDDDCNGLEDDNGAGGPLLAICYEGAPETVGVGECLEGFRRCEAGGWSGCRGQVLPTAEDCDGVDDDCDGVTDNAAGDCSCQSGESRACYGGPDGTAGVGPCVAGRQHCDDATHTFGVCEGEVLPIAELCNGADDDCDAEIDESLPGVGAGCERRAGQCVSHGTARCDPVGGGIICDAPAPVAEPEQCDGRDNNCDGRIDEDYGVGAACTVGLGACASDGIVECRGGDAACNAVPGQPVAEVGNAVDDDCDGTADENDHGARLVQSCAPQGPACPPGQSLCRHGEYEPCEWDLGPELCDGMDNDCDGEIDEALPGCGSCGPVGTTRSCYHGPGGTEDVGEC